MINVTKSYLPNKEKLKAYIDRIYDSGWLTNQGELTQLLEERLRNYLGVKHLILVANGALALQISYKALELKGEVITTPFSFAATTSTLLWENLEPVFSDIDRNTFNIDPDKIEKKITSKTTAIVPVHVFGNPCEVEKIQEIAKKNNLKVVYDAAHAFGVNYKNQSILNFGDISILSFHATKLFHTIEGGAIITNDDEVAKKIRLLINFGIAGPDRIEGVGTNAKMNEFEAAMGLCVLDEIEFIKNARKNIWNFYREKLADVAEFQVLNPHADYNYAYAPLLLKNENELLEVVAELRSNGVNPRRYFFPSLDLVYNTKDALPMSISRDVASRILCLPIYPDLNLSDLRLIVELVSRSINEKIYT